MVEKLPSVWESRDLPVLIEAVRVVDRGQAATRAALAAATGLDDAEVRRAMRSLARAGLAFPGADAPMSGGIIGDVSARAYEIAGLHPDPADRVDRLMDLLDEAIAKSTDPDERTKLQAVKDSAADVSRQTLAAIIAALVAGVTGGAIG